MFKSKSQAGQDIFVASLFGKNGTYIEVGGSTPISKNNTFNLETTMDYKGFSIELNTAHKKEWEECQARKNKIYWGDAINFDYVSALKENGMGIHNTYLSCDIEPPENTFKALQNIIHQGLSFDCITYEHEKYSHGNEYEIKSREFLEKHGYKVAVYDVYSKTKNRIFETWFVKDDIDFKPISFSEWFTSIDRYKLSGKLENLSKG